MFDFILSSSFFGIMLSFTVFMTFQITRDKLKIKNPLFNPLLLTATFIIVFLFVTKIDYEVYNESAKYVTFWLTPVTVCLAIPLYRRIKELKENLPAIIISILAGSVGHVLILAVIALSVKLDKALLYSVMPKSVTTAIALLFPKSLAGFLRLRLLELRLPG